MHVFPEYAAGGREEIERLVRRNPFALVVSAGDEAPVATHLPVVVPPGGAVEPGAVLWSHMARVNDQWRGFDPARPLLVVFEGPKAYVSASVYERTPAVPTFDYSAVHVTATPRLLGDGEERMAVLTRTVEAFEEARDAPWDMGPSLARFAAIAPETVAFALEVTGVAATFKLSQDKPDELWQRVHDAFAADPGSAAVAADMAEHRRR